MNATATTSHADLLDERQRSLYRAATPTQKLAIVARLNATLLELKRSDLQARFPNHAAKQREAMLRQWWLTARD